jgi:flavodoxin
MRRIKEFLSVFVSLMALSIAFACSSDGGDDNESSTDGGTQDTTVVSNGKTLVAYFSAPLPAEGVDGVTAATDIVREDDNRYGAARYLALLIARRTGGDTLRIQTANGYYPVNYNDLASFARNERDSNTHPALTSRKVDMGDYDNVVIVTPVWWYTIPMATYSFLDNYDLSGKHVFIATTHAGSGAADALQVVRSEEPDATVSSNVLTVRASQVSSSTASVVDDWIEELGI